jgi:hypothetical protein
MTLVAMGRMQQGVLLLLAAYVGLSSGLPMQMTIHAKASECFYETLNAE